MKERMTIGFAVVSMLLCGAAFAGEWFVSPEGSNEAAGTEAAPFRTVNYAIERASKDDTVILLPGDHVEGATEVNSLLCRVNITKPLTIRSKGRAYRDTTRIIGAWDASATSPVGMGAGAVRCVRVDAAATGVRLEGITFYRGSTAYANNSGDEKCNGGGVYVAKNTKALIVNCAFVESQATRGGGLYTDTYGSAEMKAVGCLFLRCRDTKFGAGMRGGGAYNCVFDDCAQACDSNGNIVGEKDNAKDAFAYGYQVVNCTFVNNERYGVAIAEGLFKGGIYNCLFQNNLTGSIGSPNRTNTEGNTENRSYNKGMDVFSPYDGDYRLTVNSSGIGVGVADHLDLIPEEFRNVDYYGNARITDGELHAGAVQSVLETSASGVGLQRNVNGRWTLDGEPVNVLVRTWRGTIGWPVPQRVGFVPNPGSALVRFSFGEQKVWTLPDDTAWLYPTTAGIVQTVGAHTTSDIYYADAENGSDDTGDGSEEKPFKTLNKAVQASSGTHVVYAKAGDYCSAEEYAAGVANRVVVPQELEGQLRVVALSGPEHTFITGAAGSGKNGLGEDAIRCITIESTNANAAAFQGFTLRNGHANTDVSGMPTSETMGGALNNLNTDSKSLDTGYLIDCVITGCSAWRGAAVGGGTVMRSRITDCRVPNSAGAGIFRACDVISCLVTGCSGSSEIFSKGAHARNCTIYGNSNAALYHSDDAALINSIATGRVGSDHDVNASSISSPQSMRNSLYGYANGEVAGSFDASSKAEDPVRFLNASAGDYRLSEESAGYFLGSAALLKSCMDIDGNPFVFDAGTGSCQAGCYAARKGVTYYVDDDGDESGDGSLSAPFSTLVAAMNVAEYGDTVVALPGTYVTGKMTPSLSEAGGDVTPTVAARVVVKSGVTLVSRDGAAVTVIKGAEATGGGCGNDAIRCAFLCKGAKIRGFTLTGGHTAARCIADGSETMTVDNYGGGVAGYFRGNVVNNDLFHGIVEDCVITGNMALRGGGAQYGTYRNCVFSGNTLCLGKPGTALSRAKAEGCLFYGNGTPGAHSTAYNCQIESCTFRIGQASQSGMVFNDGEYLKRRAVLNSIIEGGRICMGALTNCILGVSVENSFNGSPAVENVTVCDALLDENGRLLPGSPAIDAGCNALASAALVAGRDSAGVRRILNGTIDIGAFEYDWGIPWGQTLAGKRLVVDDMPSDATFEEGRLAFTNGTVSVVWNRGRISSQFAFSVRVTGNGKLAVMVNGESVGEYTSVDGVKELRFRSDLSSNALVFAYVPGEHDLGGAELFGFVHADGTVIHIR